MSARAPSAHVGGSALGLRVAVLLALFAPTRPGDDSPDLVGEVAGGDPRWERAPLEGEDQECPGSSGWTVHVGHPLGTEALLEDLGVKFVEFWGPDGPLNSLGGYGHGDGCTCDAGDVRQLPGMLCAVGQDPEFLAVGCQFGVEWVR